MLRKFCVIVFTIFEKGTNAFFLMKATTYFAHKTRQGKTLMLIDTPPYIVQAALRIFAMLKSIHSQ